MTTDPAADTEATDKPRRPKAAPKFNMAGVTAPGNAASVGPYQPPATVQPEAPTQPAPAPQPPAPEPQPAPAMSTDVARRGEPTPAPAGGMLASMLANSDTRTADGGQGGGINVPLGALMAGPVDPEMDLVALNVRVPRYLASALDTAAALNVLGTKRKQVIVTEAIKAHVPDALIDQAYSNVTGGHRPNG